MADNNRDYRQNGENGARAQGQDWRPEGREGADRPEGTTDRDLAGRRDERGRYYEAASGRDRLGESDALLNLGYATPATRRREPEERDMTAREVRRRDQEEMRRGGVPLMDRGRTQRDRDRGYEGWSTDFAEEGDEYEHRRAGFRDFGTPSEGQGRELHDRYNTGNWSGGFEGRDDRVAGRSGSSFRPTEWEPPVEHRHLERSSPGRSEDRGLFRRRSRGWEHEPLTAREVMTSTVRSVREDATLQEVAQIMKDENCGVVPVVRDNDRLVGLITDRDMVMRTFTADRPWAQIHAREVMTDDVEAVTPDEAVHEIVRLMGKKHIRRVPVVDRGDRLMGMISMTDVARKAESDETLQEAMVRVARRRSFWSKLWT